MPHSPLREPGRSRGCEEQHPAKGGSSGETQRRVHRDGRAEAGYKIYDRHGEKIGKVDDLFVDENDQPEYVGVKMGFLGKKSAVAGSGSSHQPSGSTYGQPPRIIHGSPNGPPAIPHPSPAGTGTVPNTMTTSPGGVSSPARGWDATGGWSKGRSPG